MKKLLYVLAFIFTATTSMAQLNTQRLLDIGRNALYFEDYVVAIQYFNQVIKVKPYLTDPYLYRAYAKLNLEDYRGSISDCNKALEINPFLPKVYYCRGYAYRQINMLEASTDDFKASLKLEPDNINTTNLLIENLIRQKLLDEALSQCDSFLIKYPRYTETYLLRSQIYLEREDTIKASGDLDTAISISSENDLAHAFRAMLRYEQKKYAESIEDMNDAIRINAFRSDYFGNRAIIRMQTKDLRGAMNDFDTAIEIDNKNASVYFNRGILRSQVGDDNYAIDDFTKCIALDPSNYTAYLQRAYLRSTIGDLKGSVSDFTKVIERYPDFVVAYYGRSEVKKKMRDKLGAERDYYTALNIENEIKSGKRKQKTGKEAEELPTAESRAIVQELNKKQNDHYKSDIRGQVQYKDIDIEPLSNFVIGIPYSDTEIQRKTLFNKQLDDYNKRQGRKLQFCINEKEVDSAMLEEYFKAIDNANNILSKDSLNETALMERAYCLSKVQDYASALKDFDRILPYHPNNVITYFNRGNARLKAIKENNYDNDIPLAEYTMAVSDFMMAAKIDPTFIYAIYNAGYVYMQEKSFQKAIECYNNAINIYPEFAEAYYNRGLIYLFQGDKVKGRADLSKAGELGIHGAYNVIRRYAY